MLEEERIEMRNDFYDKLSSYNDENELLKLKLKQYEPDEEPGEEKKEGEVRATKEDDDINIGAGKPTTAGTAGTDEAGLDPSEDVQTSGLFNSIASFFLTDSELDST